MDLHHSCICSHHLWAPWTKGKCPLCFILLLCPCLIPWSTASGIKMSMLPWRKFLREEYFCDQTWHEHDILGLAIAYYTVWMYGSLMSKSLPVLNFWAKNPSCFVTLIKPVYSYYAIYCFRCVLGCLLSKMHCTVMFMKVIPMHVFHCCICRT